MLPELRVEREALRSRLDRDRIPIRRVRLNRPTYLRPRPTRENRRPNREYFRLRIERIRRRINRRLLR